MTRVRFIESNGTAHDVEATNGQSVMQAARDNMVPGIIADCGGACSCATCHAYVDEQWISKVPPPSGDEVAMLECTVHQQANSRLTCQVTVSDDLDGLVMHLPVSQF